jgi:uncharacterized protein
VKFLVLAAVLVIAYLVWRNGRIEHRRDASGGARRAAPPPAQEIVGCSVCSVHLPRAEAITGADGRLYCSQEHRLRGGG